jgi:hypothetical protein
VILLFFFDEPSHVYTILLGQGEGDGEKQGDKSKYTSVTTLIYTLFLEFDAVRRKTKKQKHKR